MTRDRSSPRSEPVCPGGLPEAIAALSARTGGLECLVLLVISEALGTEFPEPDDLEDKHGQTASVPSGRERQWATT